jgi:2-polyprenyl-6-methoxyphenol hydroxylase-like FAD-dependent oxidoreductase
MVSHSVPGRQVSRWCLRDDKTLFLFVFRDEYVPAEWPSDEQGRRAVLASVFADAGWECPRILEAMRDVDDVYFDHVSQIRMDRWAKGRTVLLGDAAACVSLMAGEGAGLAMAEAYVLAGELRQCGGDHAAAFARYQERLMPLLKRKQQTAAKFASSFAPRTAFGVWFRNAITRLLRLPWVPELLFGRALRDVKLPDYAF